jgi:hypothetical protein
MIAFSLRRATTVRTFNRCTSANFPGPTCDTSRPRSGGAWHTAEWRTDPKTSAPGRAARYGPPRPHASRGTPNRGASGSTAGIRDCVLVSSSDPPQGVPPGHQAGPGDVRASIDRRLDRAFVYRDLGTPHLSENSPRSSSRASRPHPPPRGRPISPEGGPVGGPECAPAPPMSPAQAHRCPRSQQVCIMSREF